jgi:oxygen-independent coproporphyrinogen-3 oxidase
MTALPLDELVNKYARPGPRYTSYPTAVEFNESVDRRCYEQALQGAAQRRDEPWSVYVHVPFCRKRCTFCACAVVVSPDHDRVAPSYVKALIQELSLVRRFTTGRDRVAQLHLGGGTPTYLEPALLSHLLDALQGGFTINDDAERSIEVDPRVTTEAHLDVLSNHGFNRLSMGVQDLDQKVQKAIGREQSVEETLGLLESARKRGIEAFNVDLIYGLPYQSEEGMRRTVQTVVDAGIGRVAVYGYAHVPWMRGHQKRLPVADLPDAAMRKRLADVVRDEFERGGYKPIGLDHFARPDDDLALAVKDGRLQRNFMGYTVNAGSDLLGLGVSSIGDVDGVYVQNNAKLVRYVDACHQGRLATERGRARTDDDELRRAVIDGWMCHGKVERSEIAARFGVDFDQVFTDEMQELRELVADGVVEDDGEVLRLHPDATVLVRNVAMVFDAYMKNTQGRFSKTV